MNAWRDELAAKASHLDPGDAKKFGGSGGKINGETPLDCLVAEGLTETLDAYAWAELEIQKEERLLGDLVTPGSRTFLVGATGLGKTMLAYEMAGAMASGKGFLHWMCDRPSRWLVIDGEMPSSLIKKRIGAVLKRHKPPRGSIIIYSLLRAEEIAEMVPEVAELPPLNTPEGHAWVLRHAKALKVDGVLFDNVMSLIEGEQKEELPWMGAMPLVKALSSAAIAQIWLDHTGWNADRQYGSSRKAWTFDSVGIMKSVPETERREHELAFCLSFDAPGKCRRRTPENWRDFQSCTLRLADGKWTLETSAPARKELTPIGQGWFRDLIEMFATPGLAEKRTVMIGGGDTLPGEVLTLTRQQVRNGFRHCGRIGEGGAHERLTDKDRTELRKRLNEMKDCRKIVMAGELVCLIDPA